jgi:predicted nucleic acid-binding protein
VVRVRVALDTNLLVSAVCSWHEHHRATFAELRRLHARRSALLIPEHCLLEAYSVLTRLPGPQRLPPRLAAQVLREAFSECELIPMPPVAWDEIDQLARGEVRGGRVYDARIAESAARARAGALLTWNVADFAGIAPAGLAVRTPE